MMAEDDQSMVESTWGKNVEQLLHQLDPEIWKNTTT